MIDDGFSSPEFEFKSYMTRAGMDSYRFDQGDKAKLTDKETVMQGFNFSDIDRIKNLQVKQEIKRRFDFINSSDTKWYHIHIFDSGTWMKFYISTDEKEWKFQQERLIYEVFILPRSVKYFDEYRKLVDSHGYRMPISTTLAFFLWLIKYGPLIFSIKKDMPRYINVESLRLEYVLTSYSDLEE